MKKIALILGLGSAAVILLLLTLILFTRSIWREDLPMYPDVVTDLGTYWIDSERYIRISDSDGDIIYREGTEGSRTSKLWESSETAIAIEYSDSGVELVEGWRIGMQNPDTIIIETGNGNLIRRSFGERTNLRENLLESLLGDKYHELPEDISDLLPEHFANQFNELRNKQSGYPTNKNTDSEDQ